MLGNEFLKAVKDAHWKRLTPPVWFVKAVFSTCSRRVKK
jgi:hypothetical protein